MGRLLVIGFVVAILTRSHAGASNNLGIYGGNKVSIKDVPFIAALYISKNNNKTFFCGGTIIHDRFILTAAHCLRNSVVPLQVWGYVGLDYLYDPDRILIKPENKFCHEKYDDSKDDINDICLLKLRDPLKFGSKVKRVTMPDERYELQQGTLVNVTGWGFTENSNDIQATLRQATVPISTKDCRGLRKTFICTRSGEGRSSCKGDSGGPVTYGRVLIGVVSGAVRLGKPCGDIGVKHTRVTSYLDWIKRTILNNLH